MSNSKMLKKIQICYKNYNFFFDTLFNKLFFNTTFIQVLFLNMHLNFVLLLYFVFNFSFIKMFTSSTPKHKIPWFIS